MIIKMKLIKKIKKIIIIKSVMIILKVFMNCNKYHSQLLHYVKSMLFKGLKNNVEEAKIKSINKLSLYALLMICLIFMNKN